MVTGFECCSLEALLLQSFSGVKFEVEMGRTKGDVALHHALVHAGRNWLVFHPSQRGQVAVGGKVQVAAVL